MEGTFRSIKIIKRKGEFETIENTERIEDADDIAKPLTEGKHWNVEIKQINSKIVSTHRTIKTYFKK